MPARVLLLSVLILSAFAAPAWAQAPSSSSAEVAVGVVGSWREGTAGGAPGGGVGVALRAGRLDATAEASGVRRNGHNDWRIVGGPRLWISVGPRGGVFAHGLAGVLIRNDQSGLALVAGLGAEWRGGGRVAFRVQADVTSDRANGVRANGARGSAWVVIR